MTQPCPDCGHIHASNDARAVGRFTATPTYRAATAGTPPRATRAEAEADECAARRRGQSGADVESNAPAEPMSRPVVAQVEPTAPAPFPAAVVETAARAKAWRDFLAQVRISFIVWDVDPDVRRELVHPLTWVRSCHDDLTGWVAR